MYKDYLLNSGINEENIININFESVIYDDIKNYKDLSNNIGSPISSTKISDYLNNNKIVEKSNHQTIDNCLLNILEKSFIMYKVDRTYIKIKYY